MTDPMRRATLALAVIFVSGCGDPDTTVVLADHQALAETIAVDGDFVYWSDGGQIARVPKVGGDVEYIASFSELPPDPAAFVSDGEYLYWAVCHSDSRIVAFPVRGGGPLLVAADQLLPCSLAADGESVYYPALTDDRCLGTPALCTGIIRKVPRGGGEARDLAGALRTPTVITRGGDDLFAWMGREDGAIIRVSTGGGAVTTLADHEEHPSDISVGNGNVYWLDRPNGVLGQTSIRVVNAAGGSPRTLVQGTDILSIAAAGDELYFTQGGVLRRVAGAGGDSVEVRSAGRGGILALTADSTDAYWIEWGYPWTLGEEEPYGRILRTRSVKDL